MGEGVPAVEEEEEEGEARWRKGRRAWLGGTIARWWGLARAGQQRLQGRWLGDTRDTSGVHSSFRSVEQWFGCGRPAVVLAKSGRAGGRSLHLTKFATHLSTTSLCFHCISIFDLLRSKRKDKYNYLWDYNW